MSFSKIIKQDTAKKILTSAIQNDRIAHAYLFYGEDGVGKETMAMQFAKAVNCLSMPGVGCDKCISCHKIDNFNHPDVKLIFPTPSTMKPEEIARLFKDKAKDRNIGFEFKRASSISINTIRELQKEIAYRPFEGRKKVYIILDVDKMTIPASNALLKTLEEPPHDTILVLTTSNPYALLDTIRSRCQLVFFGKLPPDAIESYLVEKHRIDGSQARLISRLANGSLGKALRFAEQRSSVERQEALEFIETAFNGNVISLLDFVEKMSKNNERTHLIRIFDILLLWFRDIFLLSQGSDEKLLTNIDMLDKINEMERIYSLKGVEATINLIEEIKYSIKRNVNIQLALITFLLELRRVRHF